MTSAWELADYRWQKLAIRLGFAKRALLVKGDFDMDDNDWFSLESLFLVVFAAIAARLSPNDITNLENVESGLDQIERRVLALELQAADVSDSLTLQPTEIAHDLPLANGH